MHRQLNHTFLCRFWQASFHTTSSASRQASCCLRCHRSMTWSRGSVCCSCQPSHAWLWCLVLSFAASVRSVSNWTSSRRMASKKRRSSDDIWEHWNTLLSIRLDAPCSVCLYMSRVHACDFVPFYWSILHLQSHLKVKIFSKRELKLLFKARCFFWLQCWYLCVSTSVCTVCL